MGIFDNREVSLLTKHGKEAVIGPIFAELGCRLMHTDAYDTDLLGTFTTDTPRYGSQLDAARKKAKLGMELLRLDLGIANEGAFVNDPYAGMASWNNELIVLIDNKNGLEINGFSGALAQNENAYISHWEDMEKFAVSALFPSHHLIIKPTDEYHPKSQKGIHDFAGLKAAFEWAKALSSKSIVYVENDLRAFSNPTRMENIRRAAMELVKKVSTLCPKCQTPGYWIQDIKRGLPCNSCGLPTDQEIAKIWGCMKCNHQDIEGMKVLRFADPSTCNRCNP